MFDESSPYEVLGIDPESDQKTIRRAYLQLIKKHKPDSDPDAFQRIRSAYESLKVDRVTPSPRRTPVAPAVPAAVASPPANDPPTESARLDDFEPVEEGQTAKPAPPEATNHRPAPPVEGEYAQELDHQLWIDASKRIDQALIERQPHLAVAVLEDRAIDAYDDRYFAKLSLIYRVASALIWMAPALYERMYERFGHVLEEAGEHQLGFHLLMRQRLSRTWFGFQTFRAPPRGLVDLIELSTSLEADSGQRLARRFLEAWDDNPKAMHQAFEGAANLDGGLAGYLLEAVEYARGQACDWELLDDPEGLDDSLGVWELNEATLTPLVEGWEYQETPTVLAGLFFLFCGVFAYATDPGSIFRFVILCFISTGAYSSLRGHDWLEMYKHFLGKKKWQKAALAYCVQHGLTPHLVAEAMRATGRRGLKIRAPLLEDDQLSFEYEVERLRAVLKRHDDARAV